MIISHRHKFAFFRIPKTGTTTAQVMLRMCGAFDDTDTMTPSNVGQLDPVNIPYGRDIDPIVSMDGLRSFNHVTPAVAIEYEMITLEQLREYDCYSFVRDPYKRHLSAICHLLGRHVTPKQVHRLLDNTLEGHEMHPKVARGIGLVGKPQVDYFFVDGEQVVEPLNFSNYQSELRRMIKRVGGIDFPLIPKFNARTAWHDAFTADEFWTDEYRERFAKTYADDIAFYNKMISDLEREAA